MNAELKKQLADLSPEEKEEAYCYLMPYVNPASDDDEISPELMAELDRRMREHDLNPEGSMTLEEFKKRQFGNR